MGVRKMYDEGVKDKKRLGTKSGVVDGTLVHNQAEGGRRGIL